MKTELVTTSDGSHTLFLHEMNEQYHSLNGAITESNHVYIESGFLYCEKKNPVIFEVGFGTGLNALLTAIQAEKTGKHCTYLTIEKYPISNSFIRQLNYGKLISGEAQNIFKNIHECEWNKPVSINNYFTIHKIQSDIKKIDLTDYKLFDIIYFDAFGPDKQPEMWTTDIINKISNQTSLGGIIVTYSAKGEVRRQFFAAGFNMERLPGPPGKKQMLRGIKRKSSS